MKYLQCNIDSYNNDDLKSIIKKLNKEHKNEISKIQNFIHRKRKIVAKDLLIKGFMIFYNLDYSNLDFQKNKNGKSYITNANIYFNISHSHNYCICVFSNKEIGIDIEKIRKVDLNVINYFCTENEIKYILKSKKNIYQRLFEIYTLKEAYFKMKGEDLGKLKNIEFTVKKNKISCNDKGVSLKCIKNLEDFIISVCEKNKE